MPIGNQSWVDYAELLRIEMFRRGCFELTVPVENIKNESGTDEPLDVLQSVGFWNPVREQQPGCDTMLQNGVLVDFLENSDGQIDEVTFSLDVLNLGVPQETWDALSEDAKLEFSSLFPGLQDALFKSDMTDLIDFVDQCRVDHQGDQFGIRYRDDWLPGITSSRRDVITALYEAAARNFGR